LFSYSLPQETGFCSAPSESKSKKPLYWKVYESILSPLNLQSQCKLFVSFTVSSFLFYKIICSTIMF
jgi:hypothetical protein